MIRIKDYIFNENEILSINENKNILIIFFKNPASHTITLDATFDDIEWNYGTPQETQRKMQKELCKSCYYRDTISNKLKELEEKYDKALTELAHESHKIIELEEKNKNLQQRIDKATEYIENIEEDKDIDGLFVKKKEKSFLNFLKIKKDLLKIFKGDGINE